MSAGPSLKPMPSGEAGQNYDRDNERRYRASTGQELEQKHDRRSDLRVGQGMSLILTSPGFIDYAIGFSDDGLLTVTNYDTGVDGIFVIDWQDVQGLEQELLDLASADGVLQSAIASNAAVGSTNTTAIAAINTELTAARDGEVSLSAKLTDVEAAIVTGDAAEATARAALQSTLESADTTLQSNIDAEASARATAVEAEATSREALEAQTLTSVARNLFPYPNGLGSNPSLSAADLGWQVSGGTAGPGGLFQVTSVGFAEDGFVEYWASGYSATGTRVYGIDLEGIAAGRDYTLSLVATASNIAVYFYFACFSSDGSYLGESASVLVDGTRQQVTRSTPSGTSKVRISFYILAQTTSGYSELFFRKIKFEKSSSATAFSDDATSKSAIARTETLSRAFIDSSGNAYAGIRQAVEATGSDPALMSLESVDGTSKYGLVATIIRLFNNVGSSTIEVMRAVGGYVFFSNPVSIDKGGRRLTIGPNSTVVFWFGPDTLDPPDQTRTNGYWAFGTDAKVYYGSAELVSGSKLSSVSPASLYVFAFGAALSTGVATPNGGSGTYTYQWSYFSGDQPSLTNATTSNAAIGNLNGRGVISITVTDTSDSSTATALVSWDNTPI